MRFFSLVGKYPLRVYSPHHCHHLYWYPRQRWYFLRAKMRSFALICYITSLTISKPSIVSLCKICLISDQTTAEIEVKTVQPRLFTSRVNKLKKKLFTCSSNCLCRMDDNYYWPFMVTTSNMVLWIKLWFMVNWI